MPSGYTKEKFLQIKEEGRNLLVGERKYITCPFCQAEHEQKLCITRTESGFLFHCFRASCGRSGIVGDYYQSPVKEKKTPEYRRYQGFLTKLPKNLWENHIQKYGISYMQAKFQGLKYAVDEDRIYYPIYNYLGYQIGETLKAIGEVQPKNLTNKWTDVPLLNFPLGQRTSSHIVLVEDIISSIKVSVQYTAAALMGTSLTEAGFEMLMRNNFRVFTLFLDGDALLAAYKIANKYGPFAKFNIINTPEGKDPKDLSHEDITALIKG